MSLLLSAYYVHMKICDISVFVVEIPFYSGLNYNDGKTSIARKFISACHFTLNHILYCVIYMDQIND